MSGLGAIAALLAGGGQGFAAANDDRNARERQARLDAERRAQQATDNGNTVAQLAMTAQRMGYRPPGAPSGDATALAQRAGDLAFGAPGGATDAKGVVQHLVSTPQAQALASSLLKQNAPQIAVGGQSMALDPTQTPEAFDARRQAGQQDFERGQTVATQQFQASQAAAAEKSRERLAGIDAAYRRGDITLEHKNALELEAVRNAGDIQKALVMAGGKPPGSDAQIKAGALVPKAIASDSLVTAAPVPSTLGAVWNHLTPNVLNTEGGQVAHNAADQFINAILRPESGASITKDEVEQAKRQYIPAAGDSPAVLAQKAEARKRAVAQVQSMAGRAAPTAAPTTQQRDWDVVAAHLGSTAAAAAQIGPRP